MNWKSWQDFLTMGGYGAYVWGSYGVTAAALAIEWLLVSKRGTAVQSSPHGRRRVDRGAVLHEA